MNLPLPSVRPPTPVADPAGAVYTPDALARAVVLAVLPRLHLDTAVLEPSVGGGAFVRAIRQVLAGYRAHITGVDIDPTAAGLALCDEALVGDWPTVDLGARTFHLAIGNPPFGRAVGIQTTIAHVRRCLEVAERTVLVLPLAYVCGSEFDAHVWRIRRPEVVHRVTERPWPDRLREVAVVEWGPTSAHRTQLETLTGWP